MKRIKRSLKGVYWRKVITYLLTCCLFFNTSLTSVMATPAGGTPDLNNGGGATITYNTSYGTDIYDHTTLVDVDTTRTIINWTSLDTAGGAADVRETLAFTQGDLTGSAVLNRVTGPQTLFNGDLSAPGMRIFMVNPAGIIFGGGSTVNVTQLVASGLNMSNDAFNTYLDDPVNNKMEFAGGDGIISNRADITSDSVFLIGRKVFNYVPIIAPDGVVVMAAGDEVRLYENGSDVSVVVSDFGDGTPDVRCSGYVQADNGKIVLAAGDTFSRAVSNVGYLAASGGEINLQAAKVENTQLITVSSSDGNAGSISLTGTESVTIKPDALDNPASIEANGGTGEEGIGDGGTVTIQTDGLFKLDEDCSITAAGGSVEGKGGSVTINSNDFEILGDISASPGVKTEEPGTLAISAVSNVSIADGANAGETNTLYEEDIENYSLEATDVIVSSQEGITVKDISDNEITGQFGSIELHATGDESAVTFADNTVDATPDISDTIKTTLGDIVIESGSGGINAGNLTTGKDLPDETPNPGQIILTTNNEGDITTGDLTITGGWGLAKIDAKSSGDLTVNGEVTVGSETSPILNVPNGENAQAEISLKAADNIVLEGNVEAYAQGVDDDTAEGDVTTAKISILAGTDQEDELGEKNATINGNIIANAQSSTEGTSEAIIEVDAWGNLNFPGDASATADDVAIVSIGPDHESDEDTNTDGDHAQIIINEQNYPTPPLIGNADDYSAPKNESIPMDVLANDTQAGETVVDGTIDSYDIDPAEGSITPTMEGDNIVSLTYNPPEDLSALEFDENGEATVTFTYVGKTVVEGEPLLSDPTTVTITLTNNLPVAIEDLATVFTGQTTNLNVLTNDTDQDTEDILKVVILDEGTDLPKNGTLELSEDGTTVTYTSDEDFLGDDSFFYAVTDGANTSEKVEVKITVSKEPPPPLPPSVTLPLTTPAPGLDRIEDIDVEISGYPALAKWVALELGVDEETLDIQVANSPASTTGIQPYESYSNLREAALILQDADGSHIAALAQVINEFASSTAPPTEEQMAAIADAIRRNTDEESYYTVANEYLDALVTYVGILSSEMGFSTTESVQIVTDKYISRLTEGQNVGVAAFLAASLAALEG